MELIGQVGAALDAAHERGLVHRDVKPANVLLERRRAGYHAYLTDFGLVKSIGATSGVLTRTGQWLGTPDYAAPEQILGADVDARTDVYALGCMLYQAIAGRPPSRATPTWQSCSPTSTSRRRACWMPARACRGSWTR